MKFKTLLFIAIATILIPLKGNAAPLDYSQTTNFNIEKDLLLVQYDCKTDVDDLHSVAAFITLMSDPDFIHSSGQKARNYVEEYSWMNCAEDMESIYKSIIK